MAKKYLLTVNMLGAAPKRGSSKSTKTKNHELPSKEVIKRLAYKGGVVQISSDTYDFLRSNVGVILTDIARRALIITEHFKRRTVSAKDVLHVLKNVQEAHPLVKELYSTKEEGDLKRCKLWEGASGSKKRRTENRIKFYQSQHSCVYIPKETFGQAVREIAHDTFGTEFRFSADALVIMQLVIEDYIIRLFDLANNLAIHAGRKTVAKKDLDFGLSIVNGTMGRTFKPRR